MTATLIVFLIITILALIFVPFSRALMRDREELAHTPLDKKFETLIARVNKLMMGGRGEIIRTKDPRQVNLFTEDRANLLINFYYSTGNLTVIVRYKYLHVELDKEMKFDNMRNADTFRQHDAANAIAEEAQIAMAEHQAKVDKDRGLKTPDGKYRFSDRTEVPDINDPVGLVRSLYDNLSTRQKLAVVNAARLIVMADGTTDEEFKHIPQLPPLLQNLQVNVSQADLEYNQTGQEGVVRQISRIDEEETDISVLILALMPFAVDHDCPVEDRIQKFYEIFDEAGYPQSTVDEKLEMITLLYKRFG